MNTTAELKIADIFKKKRVSLVLKGEDKEEVIAELVDLVARSSKLRNKRSLAEALLERERLGSTAIGNGVAIPHTKIDGIKEPILVFGRSAAGVDFNSLDGEKTYIFFMLISPKEEIGIHLKILARISHIIKDKFIVSLLKKATSQDEIVEILEDSEARL